LQFFTKNVLIGFSISFMSSMSGGIDDQIFCKSKGRYINSSTFRLFLASFICKAVSVWEKQ